MSDTLTRICADKLVHVAKQKAKIPLEDLMDQVKKTKTSQRVFEEPAIQFSGQ